MHTAVCLVCIYAINVVGMQAVLTLVCQKSDHFLMLHCLRHVLLFLHGEYSTPEATVRTRAYIASMKLRMDPDLLSGAGGAASTLTARVLAARACHAWVRRWKPSRKSASHTHVLYNKLLLCQAARHFQQPSYRLL